MNKTILVVEDEEDVRWVFKRILMNHGYALFIVNNGKQALEILKTKSFDLIILDWLMPVMNGLDFLKEVENKKIGIPVLICTGAIDDFPEKYPVLEKPFSLQQLLDSVEKTLSSSV